MLQPTTILGSLVGGVGNITGSDSLRGGGGGGSGAASPITKGHKGEELLPLSSSVSLGSAAKVLAQVQVSQQTGDDEERLSLLDDPRHEGPEDDTPGPPGSTVHHQRASAKRHTSKDRGGDKLEKRRNRGYGAVGSSQNHEGWNVRENFNWLWGGSQHAGLLCMVASSFCYSLMGLLVRLLAVHSIPPFETVAIRCGVISVMSAAGLAKMGHPVLGSPNLRVLLSARAVLGFFAICSFFYSISVLPLRDASVLNFTAPVFTSLMASVFLDERYTSREMAAAASSLVGVLMINQPPILFGGGGQIPDLAVTAERRQESIMGILAALLSAALGGAALCLVRVIGKTGEPPLAVVFFFSTFTCVASLFCMLLFQTFVMPSPAELGGMVLVGIVAFAAQVLLTRSLQLEKAGRAASMQYMKVVGTYVLGVLFWGEIASLKGAAGVVLIGISVAYVATTEKESRSEDRA